MGIAVKGTLLAVTLLLALVVAPPSTHAQETITIEGQLENRTADAETPQGLMVALNIFRLGENLETREAETNADGRFSFKRVPGGQGFGYIISTEYQGATYTFESDYPMPQEPVTLVIYESTSSGDAIKVMTHTLVVNAADSTAQVMNALELVGLENTGDRTFVPDLSRPGIMDMLRFSLPSTVIDLDVQSSLRGGQILQVDLGFAMTTPLPPGSYEIAYTYQASYSGGKLTFPHALRFGAGTFRVLLLHGLGQVNGVGLKETEHLVLGDRDYQRLEAYDLNAGASITLEFVGLPEPSLWQRWQDAVSGENFMRVAIPGAFGIALLALLGYVLSRKKEPPVATAEGPGQHPALMEAISRLDDRFQHREIGKQEYLQYRHELKGQLLCWNDRFPLLETQPISGQGDTPSDPPSKEAEKPEP